MVMSWVSGMVEGVVVVAAEVVLVWFVVFDGSVPFAPFYVCAKACMPVVVLVVVVGYISGRKREMYPHVPPYSSFTRS